MADGIVLHEFVNSYLCSEGAVDARDDGRYVDGASSDRIKRIVVADGIYDADDIAKYAGDDNFFLKIKKIGRRCRGICFLLDDAERRRRGRHRYACKKMALHFPAGCPG